MNYSCTQSVVCIRNRAHTSERAFSLLDTLVALSVVGTVATIAVPTFQQLIASQRMVGAVNSLVTMLSMARSEAIKRRERVVLCPSIDGRTCGDDIVDATAWEDGYLLYIDQNADKKLDFDETIVKFNGMTEGLHIRSSVGRNHVTYQPNGMSPGTNLSVTFCDKHNRAAPRAVIVSNGGRPRVSTRNASGGAIICPATS